MRIDELDEHQGLEAQMVRDWLTSKGCYRQDGPWRHPTEKYSYTDGEYGGLLWEDTLFKLRVDFELASVQALLREINPRMRKGMPSRSALEAHGESRDWLSMGYVLHAVRFCWTVNDHVQMVAGTDVFSTERAEDVEMIQRCSFWPCDRYGNKVRWPTDANGAML